MSQLASGRHTAKSLLSWLKKAHDHSPFRAALSYVHCRPLFMPWGWWSMANHVRMVLQRITMEKDDKRLSETLLCLLLASTPLPVAIRATGGHFNTNTSVAPSKVSGARSARFMDWPCHLPALCLWAIYLRSLCHKCLICKMGIMKVTTS